MSLELGLPPLIRLLLNATSSSLGLRKVIFSTRSATALRLLRWGSLRNIEGVRRRSEEAMPQAGRSDSVRLSHSDFGERCEPIHGLVGSHEDMFWEEGSDLMIWPSFT